MSLVIGTAGDPLAAVASVRERIWSIDPELPIADVNTLAQVVDDSLFIFRLPTYFVGVFSAIALVIAAVGLYGVLAFLVAQHGHEIGVRVALGARRIDVLRVVVGRAMVLAIVGIALGTAAAYAVGQVLAAVLEGVDGNELSVYLGVPLLLLAVTALASYVPAARALRVDPSVILRSE